MYKKIKYSLPTSKREDFLENDFQLLLPMPPEKKKESNLLMFPPLHEDTIQDTL